MKALFRIPTIITAILLALAANTWLQLSIQDQIAVQSNILHQSLIQSATKSEKMNEQLALIQELNDKTTALNQKVIAIQSNTTGLQNELADLDKIVAAITKHVNTINLNTSITSADLHLIQNSVQVSIERLQSMKSSNEHISRALASMRSTQTQINAHLNEMNEKTKFIPAKGGK